MGTRQIPCVLCARLLTNDEIALSMKLNGLSAPRLLCLACAAASLQVPETELEDLIAYYHESGCVHFQRDYLS